MVAFSVRTQRMVFLRRTLMRQSHFTGSSASRRLTFIFRALQGSQALPVYLSLFLFELGTTWAVFVRMSFCGGEERAENLASGFSELLEMKMSPVEGSIMIPCTKADP